MHDLETARLLGETRYRGAPCSTCGGTIRLTSNRHCLGCHRERKAYAKRLASAMRMRCEPATSPRQQAAKQGALTYKGERCSMCYGRKRYTSNRHCVACHMSGAYLNPENAKAAARIRKARQRKLAHAMSSPMALVIRSAMAG